MPTLQEILTDIDDRFPNPFSQDQKIRWLNIVQREVFKEMALEEILQFTTIKDKAIYDLPSFVEFELINSVTVNGEKYDYKDLNDYATGKCYYKLLDNNGTSYIGFYPVPSQDDLVVNIYFEKRPTELTSDNLTVTPDLREDYHEILKYGVFIIMAKAMKDVALANNYTQDYNALLKKIKQERWERAPKYPVTKDVMKKPSRSRRISEVVVDV